MSRFTVEAAPCEFTPSHPRESGFSVFEMIVSMLLLTMITALAVPKFSEMNDSFARMNTRSNLIQDLKRAQAEALTRGCRGIFSISPSGTSYSFGCDYLAYDDSSPPQADSISFQRTLPRGITMTSSSPIIFSSRGDSVDELGTIQNVTISLVFKDSNNATSSYFSGTVLGTGLFSEAL